MVNLIKALVLFLSFLPVAHADDNEVEDIFAATQKRIDAEKRHMRNDVVLQKAMSKSLKYDAIAMKKQVNKTFGLDVNKLLKISDEELKAGRKGFSSSLDDEKTKAILFVSQSMGDKFMPAVLAGLEDGATVVLRGINAGQTIDDVLLRLQNRIKIDFKGKGEFRLDPKAFSERNITAVPAIIVKEAGREHRFVGYANVTDAIRQVAQFGDREFEEGSETYQISEVDLIEEMQKRMAKIDWQKERVNAVKRYFEHRHQFISLPTADVTNEYLRNPSSKVKNDVKLLDEIGIAKAGDVHNPLDVLTLRKCYIVMDPKNKQHIERVDRVINEGFCDGLGRSILLTKLPSENFLDVMYEIKTRYSAEVFIYEKMVHKTFKIESVPAAVKQYKNRLRIMEIGELNS